MSDIIKPKENDAPIEHFSRQFYNDFNSARRSAGGKINRIQLRWLTSDQWPIYELQIELNKQIFYITCRHIVVEKLRFFTESRTNVSMQMIGGTNNDVKEYADVEYKTNLDDAVEKFFVYYAIFLNCNIDEIDIVLPIQDGASRRLKINLLKADNLTVTMHESLKLPFLLNAWLRKLNLSLVQTLTLNSPHHHIVFEEGTSSCETLKEVTNLIINARAILNIEFVSNFEGSSLVYNCENCKSPIGLPEFVDYWLTHWEDKNLKRRIVFNAKHSLWELSDLKFKFKKTGRIFQNVNGIEKLLPAETEQENISTFEVSNNHLLIEFCPLNVKQ